MVYLPPPHLATAARPSYGEAYNSILTAHRRSPLTSASSVIMLVAPDVDALCAARMLADLFKQDDVVYRTIPVSGISELQSVRDDLISVTELHTLILLNMGGVLDLPSEEWFGDFSSQMTVHVIDSARPQNLASLFGTGEKGDRIVVWDDGEAGKLTEEHKALEALMFEPEPDSEDDSDYDSDDPPEDDDDDEEEYESGSGANGKRRSLGEGERRGKRRRTDGEHRITRMSRDEREAYERRLNKHYTSGTWHGQSASATIYLLATVLERVDNDLLWFAILGLTFQYTTARISRKKYEEFHSIYYDEVFRLNPPPPSGDKAQISLSPDDHSIRTTDELRFMLFRHWTLYDAMFHSSYIASKLGIWQDKGRKKLTGLLAKMGFSLQQTQQQYTHMDMDLKRELVNRLDKVAPEYGMVELSYPSFMRCFGYRGQPLSASDAVEGVSALLDVNTGVAIEIEVEGARNGGEWFGGGRPWQASGAGRESKRRRDDERENIPPGGHAAAKATKVKPTEGEDDQEDTEKEKWWVKNFWTAYDALTDIDPLQQSLKLSMSVHRAIIRTGTSIIDKRDIRSNRNHHVVVLTQGPDLAMFSHPGILSRLALWLVSAVREGSSHSRRTKRKSLPFVVACLNENTSSYLVVGVTAALDFDDVRKNEFSLSFLFAKERCNARTRHGSFDTSVLEINKDDLKLFLETLCEEQDG
ncbi:CDC45-like protein [Armillaria gallica]|uniref:CDC45-like protein n=1 Tax=Armillaria gallica TaxID=47427 RepID=A0A2H3DH38_ARMGA|nr:CDC45-like protein [Armillaria gallica]